MLRPQDNEVGRPSGSTACGRSRPTPPASGGASEWWRGPLPRRPTDAGARRATTTCSSSEPLHDHVGDVWYQRDVFVPPGGTAGASCSASTPRPTAPPCGSTTSRSSSTRAATRRSRPTSPTSPRRARALRVTVVVNNELTWQSIPPGVIHVPPDGTRTQRYYHDFFNYAGLHRSVWLSPRPPTHIDDVTVVTDLDGTTGVVRYRRRGRRRRRCRRPGRAPRRRRRRWSPRAAARRRAARRRRPAVGARATGTSTNCTSTCSTATTSSTATSSRSASAPSRVDGTRFLINGEPFHFRGFGMHEDHDRPRQGPRRRRDGPRLRVARLARRQLVPHVALPLRRGDPRPRRPPRHRGDRRDRRRRPEPRRGRRVLRRRHRPRSPTRRRTTRPRTCTARRSRSSSPATRTTPSVVLWSIANEPESHTEESLAYFEPLFAAAREADPSRPVGFVNMMLAPPDQCLVTALADVVMLNRYYGWYMDTRRPGEAPSGARGRAAGVGRQARQADPHHRVRRRHGARVPLDPARALERGVPGRAARHLPPGVRPHRRGGRRARVELRRLRHRRRSSGSAATRRACSPATAARRPRPTTCAGAGGPKARDVCPCPAVDGDAGERCLRAGADRTTERRALDRPPRGGRLRPRPPRRVRRRPARTPAGRR